MISLASFQLGNIGMEKKEVHKPDPSAGDL